MTAIQKLIATIAVLAVFGGGLYWWVSQSSAPSDTPLGGATSTPSISTTTPSGAQSQLVTPDYKKPIAFSPTIEASVRAQLNSQLKVAQDQIAKNPLNMGAWSNLGAIHKMGGDYKAAEEYWLFIVSAYEGPATPYLSLGDLYENFLKDYTKAEVNYKLAIESNPQNVNAYASLYTMYHYTLKDDTKARAILEQGLAANPNNNYLLGLKSEIQ